MDARDWIVRLTSGGVSAEDLERFKRWRDAAPEHRHAFERERSFWQQLQILDGKSTGMPPFQRPQPARADLGRRSFLVGGGLAATAALATLAFPRVSLWWRADFSTAVGEGATYTLPDGSVAALNTNSAISVDFRPDLRLINLLKGEAEFRVKPDRSSRFRVAALGGNSDAVGTTFAVRAVGDIATVTVSEGRVRVVGPADPRDASEFGPGTVELNVEQQTSYSRGGHPEAPTSADVETALAWRSGRIIFDARPFASAIAELGRYVPERIVLATSAYDHVPISAIFKTKEALYAVEALARTQGLSTHRIPGVVMVIS